MYRTLPPLEELQQWFRYEPETGKFYWIRPLGRKIRAGSEAGWTTKRGYRAIRLEGLNYQANRLAWLFVYALDPGQFHVDHINCDPGDNRISNLRLATAGDNAKNQRKKAGTSSRLKGVSWHKRKKKWMAQIRIGGVATHLGLFHDEQAAHAAYCEAASKHFGEFARFS